MMNDVEDLTFLLKRLKSDNAMKRAVNIVKETIEMMDDILGPQLLIIAAVVIIMYFLITNLPGLNIFGENSLCSYTYATIGGPSTWKDKFPDSQGARQSPINISSCYAIVLCSETILPLAFSPEYSDKPQEMRAYNDGHTVTVYACWCSHECPRVCGGCLPCEYKFFNIRFRWGPNDDEGSEHTINCHRYALEVQATFVKNDKPYKNLIDAIDQKALLIISFLFKAGRIDNPYLRPLVNCLKQIVTPYDYADIDPVPLACLMPPFSSKYYSYNGSLTFPPCSEGVLWIIQSEPLSVSSCQVNKFRKLCSNEGPMDINTRPIQDVCGREIYFYD